MPSMAISAPPVIALTHAWVLGFLVTVAAGALYQLAPVALGTVERNKLRVESDKMFGPGTYDMKAGGYLALQAMAAEVEVRHEVRIEVVAVGDTELDDELQALGRARHVALARHGHEGTQGLGFHRGKLGHIHICFAYNQSLAISLDFVHRVKHTGGHLQETCT